MTERQQQLARISETRTLSTTDRLSLAYLARQNFEEAIEIAAQTKGGHSNNSCK